MSTSAALAGYYDHRLVLLSVLIAMLAAYAALDLAGRVTTAQGAARLAWLCGGATAMGIGIWAMHYVGMEAFHLPIPVLYDWPTVLLSLFAAVAASGVALFTVSLPTMSVGRLVAGGATMGGGISAMHYIGMEAMRMPAMCVYSPGLVLLSVVLAVGASTVALQQAFRFREARTSGGWRKFRSALVLGLAIPVMHYVGMAAATFVPRSSITDHDSVSVGSLGLACIVVLTLAVLVLVVLSSTIDRRFSMQGQRLAQSELRLQSIFDNMSEGMVVKDRAGNVIAMNKAATEILQAGRPIREQIEGEFEVFSTQGLPVSPEDWPGERALRGDFIRNHELVFRHRTTGEIKVREFTTGPMGGPLGEAGQVMIRFRDTSEQRHIDEARNRLAAIVESSEDAIIGKDDEGIVTSWNAGAEKIFGYAAEEMIGESILRLLPEDRQEEETEILSRIKRGETVEHIETVRKKKNGQFIHVSLTISPIRDASGKVVGASKIARNISERKQLQGQLYQAQKMEAIGQLTGGLAHDFNNLLGVIMGNLDLLERRLGAEDGAALRHVQTAQRAAARGADLTRRLLSFSSSVELNPAPTDLHHCVRNTVELARALGPNVKITANLGDSIPFVLVDPAGLESALLNLVVNARDAMPQGGTLTISTQVSSLKESYAPVQAGELKAGAYACVSVSDTGHGMSKETLARVFEPFFTTKERGKGTGLGLAMVYGFAKQSGGAVRIYSEPGYGTTVTLYLQFSGTLSAALPESAPVVSPAKQTGKVLVVDDEVDLLEIATSYLEDMGYQAYRAEDGISALRVLARERDIDLIVTDIVMPGGMNGVELVRKVREVRPDIRAVYSSGFPADALEGRSLPVDGLLLRKPYQRADFETAIRMALE